MPSIGSGLSVLHLGGHGGGYEDNRCGCCPYGYHIDVDFVPFTRKMLSREGEVERLQALKDKWRSERHSMDKLLGVVKAKLAMRQKQQQQQQQQEDEVDTFYHRHHQPANNKSPTTTASSTWISQVRSVKDIEYHHHHRQQLHHHRQHQSSNRHPASDFGIGCGDDDDGYYAADVTASHDDILGNGLSEAVTDFEEALSRTRPEARTLSYSIPDSQKFHTFPRIKASLSKDKEKESLHHHDTSAIGLMSSGGSCFSSSQYNKGSSSGTTSTSASTVIMREISSNGTPTPTVQKENKVESSSSSNLPSINNADSIYSHSFQLNGFSKRSGGSGDADTDKRLEYLEEQVKIIPELEVKLTLLKEEKRQLMKLLDNEKQKCGKLEEQVERETRSGREDKKVSPIAPPRRKTRDAGVGRTVLTRDVGISHTMPRTRSVGVGGNVDLLGPSLLQDRSLATSRPDSCSPTGSIPSGTIRRRIRSFDVGVQVKEHEFKDGKDVTILQIVEKVDCGVQAVLQQSIEDVEKSLAKSRVLTKNTGVLAKPRMGDIGCTAKPSCKDVGVVTIADKKLRETKSTRSVGVSAQLITESRPSIRSPSPEKPTIRKLSKTLGVNTEHPRLKTTGTNTVPESVEVTRRATPEYVSRLTVPTPSPTLQTPADSDGEREPTPAPQDEENKTSREPSVAPPRSPSPPPPPAPQQSTSPQSDLKSLSRIPRLASSPTSPRLPVKQLVESPAEEEDRDRDTPEELHRRSMSPIPPVPTPQTLSSSLSSSGIPLLRKPVYQRSDTFTKEIHFPISRYPPISQLEPLEEEDKERPSTSGSFASLQEQREKVVPSKEMQGALKVLNDALLRGRTTQQVTSAISIILHEWFRVAGTKTANPLDVEDYLDFFESYSPQLLRYIVNMPDGNGNTAMHYAVSHGNFDVVSILLDSKVCDPNKANKAGYTSVMLVSLAKILTETHRQVVRRLFSLGDVNIKAAQHGQTALMLGASHGRLDTVKLLIEAGADVNIQDEDGSTALMCAAEHGHGDIVKYLLAQADCDPNITDNDGSTALSVAMEAGHKDIGVMLYAHMHFLKGPGPHQTTSALPKTHSRSSTPGSSHNSESPSSSSHTSPLVAKKSRSPLN